MFLLFAAAGADNCSAAAQQYGQAGRLHACVPGLADTGLAFSLWQMLLIAAVLLAAGAVTRRLASGVDAP